MGVIVGFIILILIFILIGLAGWLIYDCNCDFNKAVIVTITVIYSIVAITTSFFVPYYIAKEDSNSYVNSYIIKKATIEESLKSESSTGFERIELVKQATEINADLAQKKYKITKWYGFYLNKEIENLEYIDLNVGLIVK
nr:MAG TPA: hypothetical protein [Bacteriophage sp.]